MSSDLPSQPSRRSTLKCLAFGGVGTLFNLCWPDASSRPLTCPCSGRSAISHIGFNKEANPEVAGTLKRTTDFVNVMPVKPALAIQTGGITHLSKPEEFDLASQLLSGLSITELHTVPGEHDATDGPQGEYFKRFGQGRQPGLLQLRPQWRAL